MATTVTVKGQVTLPKAVRDAAGIKPGDRVEVKATAGGVLIEKAPASHDDYLDRLYAIARRRPLPGITTDEWMKELRGDPGDDPPLAAVRRARQKSK
jgi:AbrB family looped-hinge helix DNA binding protein